MVWAGYRQGVDRVRQGGVYMGEWKGASLLLKAAYPCVQPRTPIEASSPWKTIGRQQS